MLDLNDVFLYEANTEGTGNYTDLFIDRNGVAQDNVARDPNNANRVRGIGPANQAFGNFQTGVPIDPAMIDGLEISRGPNSNIWGLGNGSGTVNAIPSAANLQRQILAPRAAHRSISAASARSSTSTARSSATSSRVRAMVIHQADEYVRQPSFSRTNRYSRHGHLQAVSQGTTLRAAVEHYDNYARRPNAILPRDGISYWQQSGRPTWDASTWTLTRQRRAHRRALLHHRRHGERAPRQRRRLRRHRARPRHHLRRSRRGRSTGPPATSAASTPPASLRRIFTRSRATSASSRPRRRRASDPLAPTTVSITDRSLYDWSEANISAANWSHDKTKSYQAQLEHFFINTPRHVLAAQLGFRREESRRQSRSFIGTSGESPMLVYMDVTQILP